MLQLYLGPDFPANQEVFAPLNPGQESENPFGSSMASWRRGPAADDFAIKNSIGACKSLGERETLPSLTIPSISKH
jgi:hypothetical protein